MRVNRKLASFLFVLAFFGPSTLPHEGLSDRISWLAQASDYENRIVMFNTNTLKYHKPTCRWAKRCTRNCIPLKLGEAIRRGGVPCKVCRR